MSPPAERSYVTAPLHECSSPGLRRQVMSQQTQVARVVDYHKRWIERWPTVQVCRPHLHSCLADTSVSCAPAAPATFLPCAL